MAGVGRVTEEQRGRAKIRQEGSWREKGEGSEVGTSGPTAQTESGFVEYGGWRMTVMESVSLV